MPISRQEILGIVEFDWFAIDTVGEVALCSSAGFGEIPEIVLQQCSLADSPIQHLDRLIALMPEIGSLRADGRAWRLQGVAVARKPRSVRVRLETLLRP